MRVLIQRVKKAKVTIENKVNGQITNGLLLFVGFTGNDDEEVVRKMVDKVIELRIFEDEQGKTNISLQDINGEILSISQFTLYANCRKGRRPSFTEAEKPERANELYQYFNQRLKEKGFKVETGIFGADMKVELLNDGPFTIMLDSEVIFQEARHG